MRVVPCVSGEAVAYLVVRRAAATAARCVLAQAFRLLRLIGPSRWPHVLGEGFLARDASVSVVVIHHLSSIVELN